jgi:hypothetical protein
MLQHCCLRGQATYPRLSSEREGLARLARGPTNMTSEPMRDPIPELSLACELQRDWARTATVPEVVDNVLTSRLRKGL